MTFSTKGIKLSYIALRSSRVKAKYFLEAATTSTFYQRRWISPRTPHSSELRNSIQTEYKFVSLLKVEMSLKDLAIWLGKYTGVNLTRACKIEEYMARALAKTVHSSTSQLGKCLHETARTKDHLDH